MRYRYDIGIVNKSKRVKRIIAGSTIAIVIASLISIPAFAAGASDGSQASPCGATHGAFADVNGNFGFLGQDGGTPGYHNRAVGQDPGATGYNNSHTDCQQ